jgi:hypothetical protein
MEFVPFPKVPRLKRDCVITEKIDGTNAQINITAIDLGALRTAQFDSTVLHTWSDDTFLYEMRAGSRTRWIVPGDDNYGFAGWVKQNAEELTKLGEGSHFGEWWGAGIQRRYGLTGSDKRFSLFNVHRWENELSGRPACCSVVPVLYRGEFTTDASDMALAMLEFVGSRAAPGFMDPEGIIVFHAASRTMFKRTVKKDEEPKGMAA